MNLSEMYKENEQQNEQDSNLIVIEEQLKQLEEQQKLIQSLTSEKQRLYKENQDQSKKIMDLSNSYRELQAEMKNNMTSLEEMKQKNTGNRMSLIATRNQLESMTTENQQLKEKLEVIQSNHQKQLQQLQEERAKKYKCKGCPAIWYANNRLLCVLSAVYGMVVSICAAVRSESFRIDFKAFFVGAWRVITFVAEKTLMLANKAASLGDKINQNIIAGCVHWILFVLVIAVPVAIIILVVIVIVRFHQEVYAFARYTQRNWKLTTAFVMLLVLGVVALLGDVIRAVIPINLMLMILVAYIINFGVQVGIYIYQNRDM